MRTSKTSRFGVLLSPQWAVRRTIFFFKRLIRRLPELADSDIATRGEYVVHAYGPLPEFALLQKPGTST